MTVADLKTILAVVPGKLAPRVQANGVSGPVLAKKGLLVPEVLQFCVLEDKPLPTWLLPWVHLVQVARLLCQGLWVYACVGGGEGRINEEEEEEIAWCLPKRRIITWNYSGWDPNR